MKIKVKKSEILPALKSASRAVSPKSPLPILTGLKLVAQDGSLVVTGTDLEIGITCTVPAQVEEPGSVVLPAAVLVNLVDKLPTDEIAIEEAGNAIVVKYGSFKADLVGFPADEYPEMPATAEGITFSVKSETLRDVLARVVCAASDSAAEMYCRGVRFEIKDGELVLVATDNHRLILGSMPLDGAVDSAVQSETIVPKKAVEEAIRLLKGSGDVALSIASNQVLFGTQNATLTSRIISAKFPLYRNVLPKEFNAKVRVNPSAFLECLERASVLADNAHVQLKVEKGFVEVSLESDRGRFFERVEAVVEGAMRIYFSIEYFKDAIKTTAVSDRDVQVGFTGPLNPAMVRAVDGGSVISIIVPRRVSENMQDKKAS